MKTVLILMLLWCAPALASINHPTDVEYVQAIIGEAADQDDHTMDCIASALHNRGNLRGVYGFKSKHVRHELIEIRKRAWGAWLMRESLGIDWVDGARNFGTLSDLIKLSLKSPIGPVITQCGDFYFY